MSKTVMPIDTQQIVNQLTAAGITQAHAGAIASVILDRLTVITHC